MADREVEDALAHSFLARLPPAVCDALRAEGERADYPAGTTVYRAGADPRAALVVRGLLRVFLTSAEGRQVTVRYARPGDVLGIAVLVGGPASTSVQAVEPSSAFRISARTLTEAARHDARVSWAIAEELNRRLYEVLEQTAVNAFGSVRQRVAAHLLDLASGRQRPGGRLVARVSQQELADAAGSVISTGTVRIRREHSYGSRKPLYWWLLTSRRWTRPAPINVYVIEHSRGLILFDTGQDRASVSDDAYFPGGVTGYMYHRLARFDIGEDDTLTAQLATLGYAPADVDTAIVSHLHQDHIGGLRELTGSELLVSAAEWAELAKPAPELRGFLRSHIQLPGLTWHQVSPEPTDDPALAPFTESLDVMGDGSLVLLPTPGHTAGSVSLLVRRPARPPLLLAGDLTYGAELLPHGRIPGVGARHQL